MLRTEWKKGNGDPELLPMEEEISAVLSREKAAGHAIKVCIGTDSQVN